MGKYRFMSLDQATKICGYAIFEEDKLIDSGTFISNGDTGLLRIEEIYKQIYKKSKEYEIEAFVFEDTFSKLNVKVTKLLCWLQGAIMQMAFVEDYGFVMYYPSSWRKNLGFKRKCKKNPQLDFKTNRLYQKYQAIEYVNNIYDLNLSNKDDDIAEAICIGLAYLKEKK